MSSKTGPRRELRVKIVTGSTTEKIEEKLNAWLREQNMCPGNYLDVTLHKLGGVYQLVLVYAEVV